MRGSVLRALACASMLLAGCADRPKIVEVKVPVAVRAQPPAELVDCTAGLQPPVFQACGPEAWSCLSPEQEARLRTYVHVILSCDRGWRAWSAAPP